MAVTPPEHDPLLDALREAVQKPDPARAQALEDRLTARLQQLTLHSERKSNMQAQLTYTRRPSVDTNRTWNALTAALALVACAVLIVAFFPRQTPPPDNNIAAPIGVDQDATTTPFPTTIPVTTTPMDGGSLPTMPPMTATPVSGAGSFDGNPRDLSATLTATPMPFGFAMPTSIPFDLNGSSNPIIIVSSARLFHVGVADAPLTIETGVRLALYLPVVTVTDLPDADLTALIAANVVELLPIGHGDVVGVRSDGSVELQLNDMLTVNGSAWTWEDSNALIAFTVIEN